MKTFLICIIFSLCVHAKSKINEEEIYRKFAFDWASPSFTFSLLEPKLYENGQYTGIEMRYWAFNTRNDSCLMEGTMCIEGHLRKRHDRYYFTDIQLVEITGNLPRNKRAWMMEVIEYWSSRWWINKY